MKHSDLCEDVKVCELVGFLLVAERIALRRFRLILPSGVLIEDFETANVRSTHLSTLQTRSAYVKPL